MKDLGYLINNDVGKPVIARLTGEQLFDLVSNTLSLKGNRGAVCNDSTLYVSSGFAMDILKTDSGYILNALTVEGKELDPNAIYSVLLCSDYDWYVVDAMKTVGCRDYEIDGVHFAPSGSLNPSSGSTRLPSARFRVRAWGWLFQKILLT